MSKLYYIKSEGSPVRLYRPRDQSVGGRNDCIHFPVRINITELPRDQIDHLVDIMAEEFGGQLFRDKDLFWHVLDEYKNEAENIPKWDSRRRIFLQMFDRGNGEVRINTRPGESNEGGAVYDPDSFVEKVKRLKEFEADYQAKKMEDSPSP